MEIMRRQTEGGRRKEEGAMLLMNEIERQRKQVGEEHGLHLQYVLLCINVPSFRTSFKTLHCSQAEECSRLLRLKIRRVRHINPQRAVDTTHSSV